MMRANPELNGGVFDLPHIVPSAAEAAKADGLRGSQIQSKLTGLAWPAGVWVASR
jgi:hypothetical protein